MKGILRSVVAAAVLVTATAAESPGDRLTSLDYLAGTWTCSYHAAGMPAGSYSATYSYDVAGNWLKEIDAWPGGGDIGLYTYDRKLHAWSLVVVDSGRGTTIFRATDDGTDHRLWHSVYPDASMTERSDRDSATQYTLHFAQTTKGKTATSWDVCKKHT
jgi:hypothetical protein